MLDTVLQAGLLDKFCMSVTFLLSALHAFAVHVTMSNILHVDKHRVLCRFTAQFVDWALVCPILLLSQESALHADISQQHSSACRPTYQKLFSWTQKPLTMS